MYSSKELRGLGRIPYPLIRRHGERKFSRIGWDEAMDMIAEKMKKLDPKQFGFYLTSRGITNESYYVAAKPLAFSEQTMLIMHPESATHHRKQLLNVLLVLVPTAQLSRLDWDGRLLFWGSVASNNSPVSTKYMYAAKKKGTKIIVINPYNEPAMDKYWVPSNAESALFGTKVADDFYQVNIGGDIAFMHGIMKHWFDMEETQYGSAINHDFVQAHVNDYELT